jgi:glycosyltransferase involved in cell wall biosynthesis
MKPNIAVVIATYNGARKVSNVLNELAKQSHPATEVVLVIDGSTDNTREVAEKFRELLPLKILEIPNKGRAGARNTGVAACESDLIVFLDDDMRPFKDCLKDHRDFHQKIFGSLLVGHILEDPALFVTDIQQYRIKLYERVGWVRADKELKPLKENEFFLAAANLSLSRDTFKKLSGFDEALRDAEDFDMGNRAFAMGIDIYYKEGIAPAYHDDLITCKSYITRQREYIKSLQKLYKLKPDIYEKYLFRIQPQPSFIKRMIYFVISTNFVVKLIDKGIFKYLLPSGIRYRLYDYIINGLIQVFPERKLT